MEFGRFLICCCGGARDVGTVTPGGGGSSIACVAYLVGAERMVVDLGRPCMTPAGRKSSRFSPGSGDLIGLPDNVVSPNISCFAWNPSVGSFPSKFQVIGVKASGTKPCRPESSRSSIPVAFMTASPHIDRDACVASL